MSPDVRTLGQAASSIAGPVPGRRAVSLLLLAGLFVLAELAVISGGLYLLNRESVLVSLRAFFQMKAQGDSWGPMEAAYVWLRAHPYGPVYEAIFFISRIKFQYVPSSLIPIWIADRLGVPLDEKYFDAVSWVFILVEFAAVATVALIEGKRVGLIRDSWLARLLCASVAVLATLVFYPIVKAYQIGQIQVWLNAAFAAACACWLTDRKKAAGVLIGAICLVKPQFGLFLIWGALRRERSFIAGWATVLFPGLALAIYLFGLRNEFDYLNLLQYIGSHGESYYVNQTVNGLVNRLLHNGDNLEWRDHVFAPFNPIVYWSTVISSAVLVLIALFWHAWRGPHHRLDFMIAALTFTMASPIAWEHHYGILPPILVTMFFAIAGLRDAASRHTLFGLLALAYILSANFLSITMALADTPFNFLQSYLFFGGLIVLGLAYYLSAREEAAPAARGAAL